jgi:Caspase domain
MASQTIYAFLIAINDYPEGIRDLNGCLADMHAFRDYLAKQCDTERYLFKSVTLENAAATRPAIIAGFNHFKPAVAGDICVFYFSGHGTQVPTTDFWEETDAYNEALVCHDTCLVDKELSCLIYETMASKSDVHFLSVMDSCNSGGNTRAETGVSVRWNQPVNYPEQLHQYYGYKQGYYIHNGKGQYSARKGRHIHFAACNSDQTAKELIIHNEYRGAFTTSLIEALETSSVRLSYRELQQRVAQKLANRVKEQEPCVDAVHGADTSLTFLQGAIAPKHRYFLSWNQVWELNAGDYHGVSLTSALPTQIRLVANPDVLVGIEKVLMGKSVVRWSDSFTPDTTKQYEVQLQMGSGRARTVAFAADCHPKWRELAQNRFAKANTNYIQLIDAAEKADFLVHSSANRLWLRQKGDNRAVFQMVDAPALGDRAPYVMDFWGKADKVMQWLHVKNMENPITRIQPKEVQITLYRREGVPNFEEVNTDNMEVIENWSGMNPFEQKQSCCPYAALRIKNTGNRNLYVSVLYLDARFGIDNFLLPKIKLESREQKVCSYEDDGMTYEILGMEMNEQLKKAGLTDQIDYFKVMVFTAPADTSIFNQSPIELTADGNPMRDVKLIGTGNFRADWTSFLIPIQIIDGSKA